MFPAGALPLGVYPVGYYPRLTPAIPIPVVAPSPAVVIETPDPVGTYPTWTLGALTDRVLRRLGDEASRVWSRDEVQTALRAAYRECALRTRCFWDQLYLENQPAGFSVTATWEAGYAESSYGVANYTFADERRLLDESHRVGPANHTCPAEARDGHLATVGALAIPPATTELPPTLTEIERVTWDGATVDALLPAQARRIDPRYETTRGPVYGYLWRQDGPRTFRQVRIPSTAASVPTVTGTWGLLRRPVDGWDDTVTGSWGVPRQCANLHPLSGDVWGGPRRIYTESLTTKIEHWREGRALDTDDAICELPDCYARALGDYALAACLKRSGPGQDLRLSTWYAQKWERAVARLKRRLQALDAARVSVLGAPSPSLGGSIPRPRLPWNYPQRTR